MEPPRFLSLARANIIEHSLSESQIATLNRSRDCVPQYLFRASSNESRGINTPQTIAPDAKPHARVEQIHKARHMIIEHLEYRYRTPSEFVSWSSSLTFVLTHATRKQNSSRESNVHIVILDTHKLQMDRAEQLRGRAAIYPAPELCRVFKIPNRGVTRHAGLIHEYLFHGRLENTGCYEMTSFDRLIEKGLYEWCPELFFTEKRLWVRVENLRNFLFSPGAETVSLMDIRMAKQLGTCFSRNFSLAMTMAFMTVKKLPWRWESRTLPVIAGKLCSMTVPESYTDGPWEDEYAMYEEEGLIEVTQFRNVLRALIAYYKKEGERA